MRLIPPPFQRALYKGFLSGVSSYQRLVSGLIRLGELAHAFRLFDKVGEVGHVLSNAPIRGYQSIGHYFLAVAVNNNGAGDRDRARELFESAADGAPPRFKAKAIPSLAGVSANTTDFDSELYDFTET